MNPEPLLQLMGYDPEVLARIGASERNSLRGSAGAWFTACVFLATAAAYASYLVLPSVFAPVLVGPLMLIMLVNMLRILCAGGGCALHRSLADAGPLSDGYRPSVIPAMVFGVLALLLSQPAQLPFWPDLHDRVEEHREELIAGHEIAAAELGSNPSYYRQELESAGFPIYRLQQIWKRPKRAFRFTFMICLLVLLPAMGTQLFSIKARRAYEKARYERNHVLVHQLQEDAKALQARHLQEWPSYQDVATHGTQGEKV